MTPTHFNTNSLPPISDKFWLWVRTETDTLYKVKRTAHIESKDIWEWPCVLADGQRVTLKVKAWAYA